MTPNGERSATTGTTHEARDTHGVEHRSALADSHQVRVRPSSTEARVVGRRNYVTTL
ncbi:MAG TPA: hypothetical protein VGD63_10285 [Steroidobacteraceae bacterium]